MVKIKDKITGKMEEFYAKYYKKGKLMVNTKTILDPTKEIVDPDIYDCPQCGKHSMETVQFAKGYSADDEGEPGLLCWVCHFMMSGEILEDYMTVEDDRIEQL